MSTLAPDRSSVSADEDTGELAARAPGTFAVVRALLRKELRVELRTLESVPAMSLFAVTTFVVFHFALNRNSVDGDLAAGILWVTLLLAAILGVNRLFVADAEEGGFDGFLLAPVDRSAMLIAKVLALLAYLLVLELVAVPAFGLLLLGPSLGKRCRTCLACSRSGTSASPRSARSWPRWPCARGRATCSVRCSRCRCWCRSRSAARERPRRCSR